LLNGAGGSIGSFAVQVAKNYGANVIAVDSKSKLEMLRSIGVYEDLDYTVEDFTKSDKSYNVIFDVVCNKSMKNVISRLNLNGTYLVVNPTLLHMILGTWASKTSDKKVLFQFASDNSKDLDHLKNLMEAGKIRSVIDKVYPLDQAVEAHRYVESGQKKDMWHCLCNIQNLLYN